MDEIIENELGMTGEVGSIGDPGVSPDPAPISVIGFDYCHICGTKDEPHKIYGVRLMDEHMKPIGYQVEVFWKCPTCGLISSATFAGDLVKAMADALQRIIDKSV